MHTHDGKSFCLFHVATLLLLTCFHTANGSANITTDQATLLILKSHIQPSHALHQNWSAGASVCTWMGVTCGTRHPRVTRLDLSNLGLAGTIPAQLGHLSFLQYLNISRNAFQGNLPEELFGLRRLRVLDAAYNMFHGHVPRGIGKLRKLVVLNLASNSLGGGIPKEIGDLGELQRLSLANNSIDGTIPEEIGNLTMLRVLVLRNNHLTGGIPKEIGDLGELQVLSLAYNSIDGTIPTSIFNISTLQSLSLSVNQLSGSLPSTMGQNQPNLTYLFLDNNSLTGQIPQSISNATGLSVISLESNAFTGPIPSYLGNLRLLVCLHLFENNLTCDSSQELSFITSLTNCRYLEDFGLDGNPLDAALPTSMGNFSSSLKRINISGCKIRGNIPKEIGNLSRLVSLKLFDNQLSGLVPGTFSGLRNLQGLSLNKNKLNGPFPDSLCNLHQLTELNMSHNKFSGAMPSCIGGVTSLRRMSLSYNRFDSHVPPNMWNLKDLLSLDLSGNSFSGILPQEIANLKMAINYMDLSWNRFTGNISSTFGNMKSLSWLSLANNELEGQIPQSLGEMVNIEWLDLSDNKLSGDIPETLEKLQLLKYLNVSHNKLRGQIPNEGPFKNLDYHLFTSNEALCGAPQFHVPLCRNRSRMRSVLLALLLAIGSFILAMVLAFSWMMRYKRKQVLAPANIDPPENVTFRRFTHQQILDATAGFSCENFLGSGSFGSVYQATFDDGIVFAVKVFNLRKEVAAQSFERECLVLSNLRHRNLTAVISACSRFDFKALVLEYMPHGSLEDWLHSDGHLLDVMQRLDIMIDVASALEYLHYGCIRPVLHCDLKPSNILLDKDMVGRVTDFSLTKLLGEDESYAHTKTLATFGYIAPEYGAEGLVSRASDVYSYGILLMETFTGKKPSDDMFGQDESLRRWIHSLAPNGLSQAVDKSLLSATDDRFKQHLQFVPHLLELALNCTVESPNERVNIRDVLKTLHSIKAMV